MNFKHYWQNIFHNNEIILKSDSKLTEVELKDIQHVIHEMQDKGKNATAIIKYLQGYNKKLVEKYKAERAFWTEVKRLDTESVIESADNLDLDEFRVILSPHPCKTCRDKFEGKTFKTSQLQKNGHSIVPAHPNCYCVLIPN